MIIKPACPKCGYVLTVDVMKIDKLAAEIKTLKAQIAELQAERHDEGEAMFNKLFGGK
jgi:outer membrane murein-binding lipoprotein Lpp